MFSTVPPITERMNEGKRTSRIPQNPETNASCLHFSQQNLSSNMLRQMKLLVSEEYLKCMPLLSLFLEHVDEKNDNDSNGMLSSRYKITNDHEQKSNHLSPSQEVNTIINKKNL